MNNQHAQCLCRRCNLYYADKSKNKYSELCSECRKEQLKYPISKLVIVAFIVVGALCLIPYKHFPQIQEDYALYVNNKTASNGDVTKALDNLKKVADNHENFLDVRVCMLDIAMQSGRYDESEKIINSYFRSVKLNTAIYSNVFYYNDKLDKYKNTYKKCNDIIRVAESFSTHAQTMNYTTEQFKKLLEDYSYSDAITYYYYAIISETLDEKEEYLNKSLEKDGNLRDSQFYLAQIKISRNKLSEAKEILEEIIGKDNEVVQAYQTLAVVNMLEGDFEKAVENAEKAHDLNETYSYSVNETLMIALYKNNKTDRLEEIKNETLENETELDEDLQMILDGKKTIQEFYLGNVEE